MELLKYFGGDAGGSRYNLDGEGSGGRALSGGIEGGGDCPLL